MVKNVRVFKKYFRRNGFHRKFWSAIIDKDIIDQTFKEIVVIHPYEKKIKNIGKYWIQYFFREKSVKYNIYQYSVLYK